MTPLVYAAIMNAAKESGVTSGYLGPVALIESGGNPNAGRTSGSNYKGLYQINVQLHPGVDPYDPFAAACYAAQLYRTSYNVLHGAGIWPCEWRVYLAHQQGVHGALALLLAKPDVLAAAALQSASAVYAAHPETALAAIVHNVGPDYSGHPAAATAGQFCSYWRTKYLTATLNWIEECIR